MGGARAQNYRFTNVLHTVNRTKALLQTNGTDGKRYTPKGRLRGHTHQISRTQNRESQTHNKFQVPEIHSINTVPRRKKIAHFNSTFVFKIRAKWGDIARKLSALAAPGLSYYLKRTITSLVYSASPRFRWQTHKCVGSGLHQIYWIMFIQYI